MSYTVTFRTNMTGPMMSFNMEKLEHGVCLVDFTKEDGTARRMLATRNMTFIPTTKWPKYSDRLEPLCFRTDRVVVWDLEAGEYRSFLLSRLNNITVVQSGTINMDIGKISSFSA